MRAPAPRALAIAACLLLPIAAGAVPARDHLAKELAAAREAVEQILAREGDVLAEVEQAEAALREAAEAERLAQAELEAARAALSEARDAEARAADAHRARAEALGPRLRARYRMHRQGGAGALLGASTPAAWLRLQRAFDTVLAADLAALRDLRASAEALAGARASLEAAEEAVARRAAEAEARAAEARTAAETRRLLLASIQEERKVRERVVRDLAAAQRRLDARIARLQAEAAVPRTGFGRLRGSLPWPVEGAVVEVAFGKVVNARFHTVTHHNGVDLRVHEGAEVKAVGQGRVAFAGWFRGYGNLVIVDHGDGFHTLYAHLAAMAVKEGAEVAAGDLLGLVGDTGSLKGAYLYFELRAGGKPQDPMRWFGPRG